VSPFVERQVGRSNGISCFRGQVLRRPYLRVYEELKIKVFLFFILIGVMCGDDVMMMCQLFWANVGLAVRCQKFSHSYISS
jgi:hypothetical protein